VILAQRCIPDNKENNDLGYYKDEPNYLIFAVF
jgi:hypothetical protein